MLDIKFNVPELELLTVEETANWLNVCPNTVRALIKMEVVKTLRVGKSIRIFKQDAKLALYDLARRGVMLSLEEDDEL
jgi:excisionase family DNA binding protein